jgi:uncharacterized membrane protein (GlpM family)
VLFEFQLFISFVAGGLAIALTSLLAERTEGFWRSVILTIPTTLALGFLFIGITKTPGDVTQAALMVPAGLAPSYIFVTTFAILSRFNFLKAITGGLILWTIVSAFLISYPPASYLTSTFLYSLPVVFITYVIANRLPGTADLKPLPINARNMLIRSLIGGFVIALAVFLSKTLGNTWGGLFSVFPASYSATLGIYYFTQGKNAIPSVVKSLFFPGVIGFIVYGWVAAVTFPTYGVWIGTLLSYIGVFAWYVIYYLTQKRLAPKV